MVAVQDELSKAEEAEYNADIDTHDEANKVHEHSTLFPQISIHPTSPAHSNLPPAPTHALDSSLHANQNCLILQAQRIEIESQLNEFEAEVQRLGRAKSDVIADHEGNTTVHTPKHTHT